MLPVVAINVVLNDDGRPELQVRVHAGEAAAAAARREQRRAATQLQSTFRGRVTRKELEQARARRAKAKAKRNNRAAPRPSRSPPSKSSAPQRQRPPIVPFESEAATFYAPALAPSAQPSRPEPRRLAPLQSSASQLIHVPLVQMRQSLSAAALKPRVPPPPLQLIKASKVPALRAELAMARHGEEQQAATAYRSRLGAQNMDGHNRISHILNLRRGSHKTSRDAAARNDQFNHFLLWQSECEGNRARKQAVSTLTSSARATVLSIWRGQDMPADTFRSSSSPQLPVISPRRNRSPQKLAPAPVPASATA